VLAGLKGRKPALTSVSKTIRKPSLVKAQIAFKNKKKQNMAKNDFQYGGWNYYTLQCGTIMTLISPGDCALQCGMWLWNHGSEFTKWQHPAMWYVALRWHAVEFARWQHPPMWQVAPGWHAMEFAQTSAVLEFYIWFRFWPYHRSRHIILHQSAKFIQIGPPSAENNDVMSIFKMADLSHLKF